MLRNFWSASAILSIALVTATPALAGRGTQIDSQIPGSGGCTLGSATCSNYVDISASKVFQRAYIYDGGIVSVDALLPTNWNINDPTTYGGVIWFTPGYTPGITYQVNAYFDSGFFAAPPSWGFNFFTLGSNVVDPNNGGALYPQMQVQLGAGAGPVVPGDYNSGWVGASAALAYTGYTPPAGATIGFSWGSTSLTQLVQNSGGLLVGDKLTDTDFVSTATITQGRATSASAFTPLYAPVAGSVPEPDTWAMMLMGFAAVGMTVRRKRRVEIAPA